MNNISALKTGAWTVHYACCKDMGIFWCQLYW